MKSLEEVELETKTLFRETFHQNPLGCIAISMLQPKNEEKQMNQLVQKVLYEKFDILKDHAIYNTGFDT